MSTQRITSPAVSPTRRFGALTGRWAPLPVVLAGTFMVVLDFFIVNVALPSMQSDLHASSGSIEWVVAGYALTSAIFLITAARLGDRLGRRRMFSLGLALFTIAFATDHGLSPIDALKASFTTVRSDIGSTLLSFLVQGLLVLAGFLVCGVGILVGGPLALLVQVYTYRRLSGGPIAPLTP